MPTTTSLLGVGLHPKPPSLVHLCRLTIVWSTLTRETKHCITQKVQFSITSNRTSYLPGVCLATHYFSKKGTTIKQIFSKLTEIVQHIVYIGYFTPLSPNLALSQGWATCSTIILAVLAATLIKQSETSGSDVGEIRSREEHYFIRIAVNLSVFSVPQSDTQTCCMYTDVRNKARGPLLRT